MIEIFRVTERPRDFQKVQIAIGEATDKTAVSGINSSSVCTIEVLDVRLMQCESKFLERYSYEDFFENLKVFTTFATLV